MLRPLPIDLGSVAPHHFEVVVSPHVGFEEMDDCFDEVGDNPEGFIVLLFTVGCDRGMLLRQGAKVTGGRTHLPITRARGDDDVIGDLALPTHIEDDHIFTVRVFEQACSFDHEVEHGSVVGFIAPRRVGALFILALSIGQHMSMIGCGAMSCRSVAS